MTDNTQEPESTWGKGDAEAETRIAGATPVGERSSHDDTPRIEEDATRVAPREPAQAPAGQDAAEAPTQAAFAQNGQPSSGSAQGFDGSPTGYPSAPAASPQAAPYSQGYPGSQSQYPTAPQDGYGQQGGYGGQQYGSAPQGGYASASPGQQYTSAPQGQQYGSAAPGQYNATSQAAAPTYQQGQYTSAPQGQQYGSAPQGGYTSASPSQQYTSAPHGQQYGSAAPTHQQGQYTSAPYGQSNATPSKAKSADSPIAKFGPFLPALLGLIAPFVTWVTFKSGSESVALNGIGGNSDSGNATLGESSNTGGIFVLILAIGLAVAGLLAVLGKLNAKVAGIISAAIGVVLLILGLVQFASASSAVSSDGAASGYSATIGAGVWLTLLAGLAALAVGIVAFLQARKTPGSSSQSANGNAGQWNSNGFNNGQQQFGHGQPQQFGQNNAQGFGQNH